MSIKDDAFAYIDAHHDEMLTLWSDLVNQESGSTYSDGVNKVAARYKAQLELAGAEVKLNEFAEAGATLVANFAGTDPDPVLIIGHMDTVFNKPGETTRRPFTIKDGKAYGPGVLDMKGGLTVAAFAAQALKVSGYNKHPLRFVICGDEEIGHPKSDAIEIFMREAKGCKVAFNMETGFTDNSVVTGRKGCARFQLTTKGVAAHSGNAPEKGRSAIYEMAHHLEEIEKLSDWENGNLFNVGQISGGIVWNAYPGECKIDGDIRYLDPAYVPKFKADLERVAAMTFIKGTHTELSMFRVVMNAMLTTDGVKNLFHLLEKICAEDGFPQPSAKLVGGGADSCYTVMAGVPTLCAMGVKGYGNHTVDEYAEVESLYERAKLLVDMILNIDRLEV